MSKEKRLGIRVDEKTKAILDSYAKKDGRTLSNLILKILDDWIKEKGFNREEAHKKMKINEK